MAPPRPAGSRQNKAAAFMRKAIQYYETGDLSKAQKNVAKYLSADPKNPDANHLAGLIAHKTGHPTTGITFIKRALEANPRLAMAHNNLGEAHRELEQFVDAEACYRRAIELEPTQTGFYNNLGISILAQGRAAEAVEVYNRAIGKNPRDAMIYTNLGNALLESGRNQDAIEAHKKSLTLQPSSSEALANLGIAYQTVGDIDRARDALLQVLQRNPSHITALKSLASIYETLGETEEAEKRYERLIAIEPDEREHYLGLADLMRFSGRADEAVAVFERHLKQAPTDTDSRVQIASIWRAAGQQEKAAAYLRDILETEPDNVGARSVLAQVIKHTPDDENIVGLTRLHDRTDLTLAKRASVHFALGKAREETGDLDAAIQQYKDANQCRRSEMTYAHNEAKKHFKTLIDVFSPQTVRNSAGNGASHDVPIFIVGMPRSGTSLVEQIISSHSRVFGAGELSTFASTIGRVFANDGLTYPDSLAQADKSVLERIGNMYVDLVRRRFSDDPHITDKMPHNFMNVGMIRLALPNAKIVHCNRHPMDTCFSIFKNAFSESHEYAYDMEELGAYYREYRNLMAHWHRVFPDAIYDISYEKLVDDTEAQARQLLDYCGLDWEPACLEFYKTKRVVNTVSAVQVRQPIYKSSVALWKRYGARLQPLIDALGDAIPEEN